MLASRKKKSDDYRPVAELNDREIAVECKTNSACFLQTENYYVGIQRCDGSIFYTFGDIMSP